MGTSDISTPVPVLDSWLALKNYSVADGPAQTYFDIGDDGRATYTTLCSGWVKLEGEPVPWMLSNPVLAIEAWKIAFEDWAKGKGVFLYWRTRPELVRIDTCEDGPSFYVYSRLVLMHRPATPAELHQTNA